MSYKIHLTEEGLQNGDMYWSKNNPEVIRIVSIPNTGGDNRTCFFCTIYSNSKSYVLQAEADREIVLEYIEDIRAGELVKIGNINELFASVFRILLFRK